MNEFENIIEMETDNSDSETKIVSLKSTDNATEILDYISKGEKVELDTRELRQVLGEVSLAEFEVLQWISGFLTDQYNGEET